MKKGKKLLELVMLPIGKLFPRTLRLTLWRAKAYKIIFANGVETY